MKLIRVLVLSAAVAGVSIPSSAQVGAEAGLFGLGTAATVAVVVAAVVVVAAIAAANNATATASASGSQ